MCEVYENVFRESVQDCSVSAGQISGYCNSSEEVEKLLDLLRSMGFSYCVRSSHNKLSTDVTKNKRKYFFQLLQGHIQIPFFGPAFSVDSTCTRHCVLGPKYYKAKESGVPEHLEDHVSPRVKRRRIMDTKKSDCPATLHIKSIRVFPDYRIQSANDHWDTKARVLGKLRADLELLEQPQSYLKYYILASPASAHTHSTESVEASGQIHPLLSEEIKKIVLGGSTEVKLIKLALDRFVDTFFTGTQKPSRLNTTFYPTEKTIYSHMCLALHTTNKELFDESRLQKKIDEWLNESNGHKIYYRPCVSAEGEVKPLLFCYQNSWQRDLLKKYGDTCLLDATYKTTMYDIPLFFIVVKGNVGYFVVGFFFIQVENAKSIQEALEIFKEWNKDWNPPSWVTDFSECEINAIERAFPETKVHLCLFHRRQAWSRWLSSTDHVKEPQDKKTLHAMWERISKSETEEEFRERTEELRTHEVSHRNEKARNYFEKQWLSVCKRWVKAYEEKGSFDKIETTNGVETMNKMLKHFYLKYNSDRTLTGVTTVVINSFLPSLFRKYCQKNSAIKSYSKDIPLFLHKKTNKFVKHVMQRYTSAEVRFCRRAVNMMCEGLFCVESEELSGCNYIVNFDEPNCTCPDFQKYKYPCKHFCAVFIYQPEWGFDKMPAHYKDHPLICLDEKFGIGFCSNICEVAHSVNYDEESIEIDEVEEVIEAVEEVIEAVEEVIEAVEEVIEVVEETVEVEEAVEAFETSNIPLQQRRTRELCNHIYNLTYNCSNGETFKKVLDKLGDCVKDMQLANPEVGGLPLVVASTSKQ